MVSENSKQYIPKPSKSFDYLDYYFKDLSFSDNIIVSCKIVAKNNILDTNYRRCYRVSYNINTGEMVKYV